jgi:PEP-CTERM motif
MRFQLQYPRQHRFLMPVILLILALPTQARADLVFQVSADTSSIQGLTGSFDLQFNPGGVGTLAATATIMDFAADGTGVSLNTTDGDVLGTLSPGPLTINNTFALNDLLENITFGTSISFTLTLSGPGVSSPNPAVPGSSFGLSLYDMNFNPLLTTDPAGTIITINLNSDGSTGIETFPSNSSGGAPVGSAVELTTVPEPGSLILLASGLVSFGVVCLLRRSSNASEVRRADRQ